MCSHGAEVSPCDAAASTRVQSRRYSPPPPRRPPTPPPHTSLPNNIPFSIASGPLGPCDSITSTSAQSRPYFCLLSPPWPAMTSRKRHTFPLALRYVPHFIAPLRARSHVLLVHSCTGPSPAVSTRRSIDRRHTPRGLSTAEILRHRVDTCATESGRAGVPVHAVPVRHGSCAHVRLMHVSSARRMGCVSVLMSMA